MPSSNYLTSLDKIYTEAHILEGNANFAMNNNN